MFSANKVAHVKADDEFDVSDLDQTMKVDERGRYSQPPFGLMF